MSIAGLSLQTLVLAALLRPISYYEKVPKTRAVASKSVDQSSEDSTLLVNDLPLFIAVNRYELACVVSAGILKLYFLYCN